MPNRETVAAFICDTARSLILPRFRALRSDEVREKKPGDLVTIADVETEGELSRLLTAALPGSVAMGEESVAEDPTQLALLNGEAPVWVIDPVDGTANFAKGEPGFAVIVALVERGAVEAGWIHDPIGDVTVAATRGEGVWSGSRRLVVATDVLPSEMVGSAYGRTPTGIRAAKALRDSGRIAAVNNRGCSGLEYLALALGQTQFTLHSRSLPWDHAAGMMIVAEGGGKSAFLDGSPYNPLIVDRPLLAAASERGWEAVQEVVTAPG